MHGKQKKIREIKFGNYRRCKFGPDYLLAQEASKRQYIGAAQVYPSLILQQISWTLFSAFCLFIRTLPIDFALVGQKRKYIKSKTTAKLIEKRILIAADWDKLGQIDTFLTPLLSSCRLPLSMGMKRKTRVKFFLRVFSCVSLWYTCVLLHRASVFGTCVIYS